MPNVPENWTILECLSAMMVYTSRLTQVNSIVSIYKYRGGRQTAPVGLATSHSVV